MGVVFLVLAVAVLTAAVGFFRSRRREHGPPPAASGEDVPTFHVVALGPRGSGKTLLLASMYHLMQTSSGRSYFLTAPYDQVVLLNQWFTDVADTSRDWPSGTAVGDTRDFVFTVRTRAPSGALYTVLRLGYLEYAGGLLTDVQAPGTTSQADLLARIGSAHALIGIIDGYRIRQCLDGRPEGQMRLQQSLTAMISLMMLVASPITFVVTKWDLLNDIDVDEDARLRRVRKLLMSNQGFYDLVQVHSAHRVVRLVPVSAVGPDFAELDPQGMVAKLPDGHMRPTNVDVPLAAVVPDVFEQLELSLDKATLKAALDEVKRMARPGPGAALAELGAFVARTAGKVLGAFGPHAAFVADAAVELFGSREDAADERADRVDRRLRTVGRTVDEYRTARRKVIRDFQSRVDVLEGRLPSSRLSNED
jgi:energy-coupling factor transporter ATP-binding protein EcfA2